MRRLRSFILFATLLFAGCSRYEEARIVGRMEAELTHDFVDTPGFLLRSSYGGLEEGGYVALLKLGHKDCSVLIQQLLPAQPLQQGTRAYDTFEQLDLAPSIVYSTHWTDNDGTDTTYILDKPSCVLYRQAHFE